LDVKGEVIGLILSIKAPEFAEAGIRDKSIRVNSGKWSEG